MKKDKLWRIFLPVAMVAVVVSVIIVFISAVNKEPEEVIVVNEVEYGSPFIPESVLFAGEKLPIDRFDVKEALDKELLSNAYFHSQTIRYIKMAPRYFSIIEPILKEKGIPDDFKYLAVAESGFNPRAVSPANAVGFWQFLKGTAQDFGLLINNEIDERYHVEKSTYAACSYLLDSYKKNGSWTMVAASYNAGMNGIRRQSERQKTESYFDLLLVEETGRYLYRIVALKLIMENPEKYNFSVSQEEKYPIIKTRDVEISASVLDFADFAKEQGINYKLLKDFNPWLRQNYLNVANGKKVVVKIPVLN